MTYASRKGFAMATTLWAISSVAFLAFSFIVANDAGLRYRSFVARDDAKMILEASLDIEVGARGYIVTGDREYLEPYVSGNKRLAPAIEKFRRDTQGDQSRQIDSIEFHAHQVSVGLGKAVDSFDGSERARARFHSLGTKRSMDSLREAVKVAVDAEESLLASRNASLHLHSMLARIFGVGSLLACAISMAMKKT